MRKISIVITATFFFTLAPFSGAFAESYAPSVVAEITSTLGYPSDVAATTNGDVWWSDWSTDKIYLFDKNATGDTAPKKVISTRTSPTVNGDVSAIAVDAAGFVYALDANSNSTAYIRIFNPALKDTQTAADAVRTISFARRGRGIALDSRGYIYITGSSPTGNHLQVRVFAPGVTGNESAEPVWSFIDTETSVNDDGHGIAVNSADEIVVVNDLAKSVRVYAKNSSGTPIREISGSYTLLSDDCNLGRIQIDSENRIYVSNIWCVSDWNIQIFDSNANGNVAPINTISGTDSEKVWPFSLSGDSTIWIATENNLIRKISNPLTFRPKRISSEDSAATSKAAEAARARAVEVAKTEIKSFLSSGKPLSVEQLLKADFVGVTTKNIGFVNADIAKLPEEDRSDIKQIEKVVLKFATVDRVAEGKRFYSADLVAVGLIPQDSKIKTSILATLKKLPSSSLDSFEKIQAAIASVEKIHIDRKARLAAILAKRR
jgi:hypothetical protein